jgi:hypothetical protein
MCILEMCMVLVYEVTRCENIDWWSFDESGGATGIRPLTNDETPWEEQVDGLHHYPYLC